MTPSIPKTELSRLSVLFVRSWPVTIALAGFFILTLLCCSDALAATARGITYNDSRFAGAVDVVMAYLEGSAGAMVMAAAGIVTVIAAAFGQYRLALSLLVVAVGAFVLRSLVATFFNDASLVSGAASPSAYVETEKSEPAEPVRMFDASPGVDITAAEGRNVTAYDDGVVVSVDQSKELGLTVVIAHTGGLETSYSHLGKAMVRPRQSIKAGAVVGTVGRSGLSKDQGAQLHFEFHRNKKAVPFAGAFPDLVRTKEGEITNHEFLTKRILGLRSGAIAHDVPLQLEQF